MDFINNLDGIEYVLTGCSKLNTYKNTYECLNSRENTSIDFDIYKAKLQFTSNMNILSCLCNQVFLFSFRWYLQHEKRSVDS